jgi:hypothetical protein
MSIAGYNVDPESGDPIVGIGLSENNHAVLYIDEEQSTLTYSEVCAFTAQLRELRSQMEWNMSEWLSVENFTGKPHLTRKTTLDESKKARALCGKLPDKATWWDIDPIFYKPGDTFCKRCLAVYHKQESK